MHDYRTGLAPDDLAKLVDLLTDDRAKVIAALDACRARGVYLRVMYAARDPWTQARLYRQSRTGAEVAAASRLMRDSGAPWLASVLESVGPQPDGPWATNALPGQSWHQWVGTIAGEYAIDVAWLPDGRTISWSTEAGSGYDVWREEASRVGMHRGPVRDWAHMQGPAEGAPSVSWAAIDAVMRKRWERKES